MKLTNIITPAFTCFILVVGMAIFANLTQRSPTQLAQLEINLPDIPISTPSITPKVTSSQKTPKPIATPKPTVKQVANNRCIVTINGRKYDVTTLRRTHSGGDIFVCGTDMTRRFQSQHGTNYQMIARYLI